MGINLDEFQKTLDEFCESEKGKAYFALEAKKFDVLNNRFKRFEEWLKNNDFDTLIYRLVHEHGEDYREKCYHNGFEAYLNNKLQFIFDYIEENYEIIDIAQLNCDFPHHIWFFKGYYFQIIYGQGSIHRIYNKDDMRMILQV